MLRPFHMHSRSGVSCFVRCRLAHRPAADGAGRRPRHRQLRGGTPQRACFGQLRPGQQRQALGALLWRCWPHGTGSPARCLCVFVCIEAVNELRGHSQALDAYSSFRSSTAAAYPRVCNGMLLPGRARQKSRGRAARCHAQGTGGCSDSTLLASRGTMRGCGGTLCIGRRPAAARGQASMTGDWDMSIQCCKAVHKVLSDHGVLGSEAHVPRMYADCSAMCCPRAHPCEHKLAS